MTDDKIEVFECSFKWIVRVREGGEVTERIFNIAEHAYSWAAGQRIRMRICYDEESLRDRHAD